MQIKCISVYYNEINSNTNVRHAFLVNLETRTMDSICSGPLGSLFWSGDFIFSQSCAGNSWAEAGKFHSRSVLFYTLDLTTVSRHTMMRSWSTLHWRSCARRPRALAASRVCSREGRRHVTNFSSRFPHARLAAAPVLGWVPSLCQKSRTDREQQQAMTTASATATLGCIRTGPSGSPT